jgi:integrase/recombinase XerD
VNLEREISNYLYHCEFQKKLNQKSIKAYSIDLGQFAGSQPIKEQGLTKVGICAYITNLHKQCAPKTAKRKLASLRALLNYLEFEEIIDVSPLRKIKTKFQEPKALPKTIPLKAIQQLLVASHAECNHAKTEYGKFATMRDAVIIEALFATGMRVSELCSLKSNDVDLNTGCIHITGKGAKERIIQIGNAEVLDALRKYHNANTTRINKGGFFFVNRLSSRISEQSVRFMLQNICLKASVSFKITPHMFRHSFATLLLEEDVDIRYIQRMLGHSSIQTTQIYTQVTTKKQHQILTTKHPRNKISLES